MFWSFTGNFHLLKSRPDEWLRMFVELGGKPEENDVYCYKIRSPLWNNKRVNFNPGLKVYEKWSWVIFVCMAASTTARDSWYVLLAQIFNMGGLKWLYLYTFIQTCSCFWHSFGRYHLKMDGWKTMFLLGWLPCRCNVSVREETIYIKKEVIFVGPKSRYTNLKCQFSTGKTTGFILKIWFFFREGKIFHTMKTALGGIPWPSPKLPQQHIWTLGDSLTFRWKPLKSNMKQITWWTRNLGLTDVSHLYQLRFFVNTKHLCSIYPGSPKPKLCPLVIGNPLHGSS